MLLFVSSEDTKAYYPDNKVYDFTVELPQSLTGSYLALQHVYFKVKESTPEEYYYVQCDQVQESVIAGKEAKVLGSFWQSGNLDCSQPLRLVSRHIKRLRFRISTRKFEVPTDLVEVYLTIKLI